MRTVRHRRDEGANKPAGEPPALPVGRFLESSIYDNYDSRSPTA
jgi:hypothetical protein